MTVATGRSSSCRCPHMRGNRVADRSTRSLTPCPEENGVISAEKPGQDRREPSGPSSLVISGCDYIKPLSIDVSRKIHRGSGLTEGPTPLDYSACEDLTLRDSTGFSTSRRSVLKRRPASSARPLVGDDPSLPAISHSTSNSTRLPSGLGPSV